METADYVRPSEKFGDEAVLDWAINTAGLLEKGDTVEKVDEELRKAYDAHMNRLPPLADGEKLLIPRE